MPKEQRERTENGPWGILLCDDEKDIVSALKIYLAAPDLHFYEAENGEEALSILEKEEIHLVLLDIMMPRLNGLETVVRLREKSNVPVILLTAKSEDSDKILGLNLGADDYITKPFNPVEVQARVRSQLRRYLRLGGSVEQSFGDGVVQIGGLELDDSRKQVSVDGQEVSLTPTEYAILKLLMENPGKVFSPKELYRIVWSEVPYGSENTVAVHIRHLREKIEINPAEPRYLKMVWGHGYKIEKGK